MEEQDITSTQMPSQSQPPEKSGKLKKIIAGFFVVLGIIFLLILIIPSSDKSTTINDKRDNQTESTVAYSVDENLDYDTVSANVSGYQNKYVKWGGRIFNVGPDKEFIQINVDDDSDKNLMVILPNPRTDLKADDYVLVTGRVAGTRDYENVMGGKVTTLYLDKAVVEVTTRTEAIAPAAKIINVNQSNTQNDFTVTLEKIELSDRETRIYLKAKNEGSDTVTFYTYDSKIVTGGKQFEKESVWEAKDEFPDGEILSGVEVSGIVYFPKVDLSSGTLSIYLDEPYSAKWNTNWEMVKFEVIIPQ